MPGPRRVLSGEAGLTAEPQPAVEQAANKDDDQDQEPGTVHRNLRHAGMDAQPEEDCHRGSDNRVVPPAAALTLVELAAGLRSDDGAIIELIAIALALNGDVARVLLALACHGSGDGKRTENHDHGSAQDHKLVRKVGAGKLA